MMKKKSKFWTFCFSLLPGAGEMYMGFMKMGVSLMALFFGMIALASIVNIGPLMLIAVIVWFYSFFHVHNLEAMPDEEFAQAEDTYLFPFSGLRDVEYRQVMKYRKWIAWGLIFVGVVMLWDTLFYTFSRFGFYNGFYGSILYEISYGFPRLLVGIGIVVAGICMIKGKKKEWAKEEKNGGDDQIGENNPNA